MGSTFALMALVLFACNVLLTKAASLRLNVQAGYLISICVNVLAASCMVIVEHLVYGVAFHWMWKGLLYFVIAGALTTFIGRLTYFHAIVRVGATKASTIQIASPVCTVVLAWVFLHEALNLVQLVGCVLTVGGLFVITYVRGSDSASRQASRESATAVEPAAEDVATSIPRWLTSWLKSGILFAFLSLLAYGTGNLFRGDAVRVWNDPMFGGLVGAVVGLLAFVATNPRQIRQIGDLRRADRRAVWMYVLGGTLTISAQVSVLYAMRYMPIGIVTVVSMSQPLLVIPLGYILLRGVERITRRTVVGSVLTLIGLVLAIIG